MDLTELQIEQMLVSMATRGLLLESLTKSDIDTILAHAPKVPVSDGFKRRARAAMRKAQHERKMDSSEQS